ncbi:MAG TPA: VOC family protein [Terriglobales bacterium]|jgi:Glyoxalase-like domain|nr:VOC family protein [Terriglobales bacterium]
MRLTFLLIVFVQVFSFLAAAADKTMNLKVDHASICGSDLDALRASFTSLCLTPEYGGPHGNGVTQMALIGFDDGSYLELIAPVKKDAPKIASASDWGNFIVADAGPCAWAVGSTDLTADVDRLKKNGISIKGPNNGSRKKPDGTTIEWQTAQVGDNGVGAVLPFMIQDKTPRELRVKPSASVKGGPLTGIALVVIGVKNLDDAVATFRKAYGLNAPKLEDHKDFGAKLAHFEGTPVVLAAPLDPSSWLAERLSKFGESPVAYLLGTRDFAASEKSYRSNVETMWFGRKVRWLEVGKVGFSHLGIVSQ